MHVKLTLIVCPAEWNFAQHQTDWKLVVQLGKYKLKRDRFDPEERIPSMPMKLVFRRKIKLGLIQVLKQEIMKN